eukprot:10517505-Karenia_brevis.AAC.1
MLGAPLSEAIFGLPACEWDSNSAEIVAILFAHLWLLANKGHWLEMRFTGKILPKVSIYYDSHYAALVSRGVWSHQANGALASLANSIHFATEAFLQLVI